MAQYYYTVSTLPYLQLDGEISIAVDEFLDQCRQRLSAEDMELLESSKLVPTPEDLDSRRRSTPAQRAFYRFEAGLRNELVRLRAGKLAWEAEESLRIGPGDEDFTGDTEITERAREAFQNESPRDAERQLDRARWHFLDDMEIGHYFDLDKLVVYYLKLLILDRRIHMNAAEGAEGFQAVYDKAALKIETLNMPG
jgi:hypothetical protein